jgi:hypothetical protein
MLPVCSTGAFSTVGGLCILEKFIHLSFQVGLMLKTTSILLFLMLLSFLFLGCGFSDDEDRGKAPIIELIVFYEDVPTSSGSNFSVGDTVNFHVRFRDPDLDVMTLHVVIYDVSDTDMVYDGPTVYELDADQQSENTISEEFDVAFQAGDYRVDFQLVDEKGNASMVERKKIYFDE